MKRLDSILILGASSDIGIALLEELNSEFAGGSPPVIIAHYAYNGHKLKELANKLNNIKLLTVQADFSKEKEVTELLDSIEIVPQAIIFLPASKLEYTKLKKLSWQKIKIEMDIQVGALITICQRILPQMEKQRFGKIVVMLSENTLGMPPKFMSSYVTVKYAQLGFVKAMASDYAGKGININGLSPAMIETKFLSQIDERIVEMNAANNKMKRNIYLIEVVKALEFLLSQGSDYMNGVNLNLTGGNQV